MITQLATAAGRAVADRDAHQVAVVVLDALRARRVEHDECVLAAAGETPKSSGLRPRKEIFQNGQLWENYQLLSWVLMALTLGTQLTDVGY